MKCDKCGRETDILQSVVPKEDWLRTGGFPDGIPVYRHPDREEWCKACIMRNGGKTTGMVLHEYNERRKQNG